ncbi:uncharacterized protein L199_007558 [Kwoniella botswanensis]|uniref:uncharacterized protein n=1 Tax=Kwoniella botswanensis TaxID=1268659 RepID=UPI00315D2F9C
MTSTVTAHALTSDHSFQILNTGSSSEESLSEEWQMFVGSTREYLYDPEVESSFRRPLRSTPRQRRKIQIYKESANSMIGNDGERSFEGNIEHIDLEFEAYYSEGKRPMDETDKLPKRSTEQDHNEYTTTSGSLSTKEKRRTPASRGLASDRQAEDAINSQLTITAGPDSSKSSRHRIFGLLSRARGLR